MTDVREFDADSRVESPTIEPDAAGARWLRRHLAGGVVIATGFRDGEFKGTTLSAVMCVSEDPPLILISLAEESQLIPWLEESGAFALSLLPWREQFVADQFAGFTPRASRRFAGIDHFIASTGAPVLTGSIAWADCTIEQAFDAGDHRCYLGRAVAIGAGSGNEEDPMIYYISRYRRLG